MSYRVSVETKARYLHVRVSGEDTPENVRAYLRDIYQICGDSGIAAVLVEEDLCRSQSKALRRIHHIGRGRRGTNSVRQGIAR